MKPTFDPSTELNIFVSYSRDDYSFADQLYAALSLHNFAVTLDRHEISGGELWRQRLRHLIEDADAIVFVLSPSSAISEMCAWEVETSADLGKRIIPVVCESLGKSTPPTRLEDLNYIFFYEEEERPGSGFGTGLRELVKTLNTDSEWMREHTRLMRRSIEWDRAGRPSIRLLSGPDIKDAKDWMSKRPPDAPVPSDLHMQFIRASELEEKARQDSDQQRLAERERLVQAAELAQNEMKRATSRFIRRTRLGTLLALIVISITGYVLFGGIRSFIWHRFDQQLERLVLQTLVNSYDAGKLVQPSNLNEPLFEVPSSGWYWQIQPQKGETGTRFVSNSLMTSKLPSPIEHEIPPNGSKLRVLDALGPSGEPLRIMESVAVLNGQKYSFVVAGPRDWPAASVSQFGRYLVIGLGIVAVLQLTVMTYISIGFGRLWGKPRASAENDEG